MNGRRRTGLIIAGAVVLVVAIVVGVAALTSGSDADLTVYNARSHYGEEAPFKSFEERNALTLEQFGGSASELYERIKGEGADTKADALITVDLANLWRAKEEGILEPVTSPALEANVPEDLRDPDGAWYGLTLRARTIMRSTERVGEDDLSSYEDLGDPQWRGRI